MKTMCRKVRKRLMTWKDANSEFRELDACTADHLGTCPTCRRFAERLISFRADGRKILQDLDSRLGSPNMSFLADAVPDPQFRSWRPARLAAAAVLAVCIGFAGYFGGGAVRSALQLRSDLRAETGEFVESLFSEPLFHDSGRISSVATTDIFAGTDIVSDLVLPDVPIR